MKRELPNASQIAFLAAYAAYGSIVAAATESKVARSMHYEWLREDETYKARFDAAHRDYCDALEDEIDRRGRRGFEEPVVYQGKLTYEPLLNKDGTVKVDRKGRPRYSKKPLTVRKYSDNLLMFRAKAAMPDKYRDNAKIEHTGPGGAPLSIKVEFE